MILFVWEVKFVLLNVEMVVKKTERYFQILFKKVNFEGYYKCLFGWKYQQECDDYILRSLNHEKLFQKVLRSTLSQFDDKRCYEISIETKL